jgi:hypothetical protein
VERNISGTEKDFGADIKDNDDGNTIVVFLR